MISAYRDFEEIRTKFNPLESYDNWCSLATAQKLATIEVIAATLDELAFRELLRQDF